MIDRDRSTPILFLVFNRPSQTRETMSAIRTQRPSQLFVACDGPRDERIEESALCDEVKRIATQVDWECELHTLFREKNLGCEIAVSTAISWFFKHVEQGIIIEDDCLPDPSFFPFCSELLERYKNDDRIGAITGDNFQFGRKRGEGSYYFSKYFHCWGWASWRTSWANFDLKIDGAGGEALEGVFSGFRFSQSEKLHWERIFERLRCGELNTWDYRWQYWLFCNRQLTATPQINLVRNIGFGLDATHTSAPVQRMVRDAVPMQFPLVHPSSVQQSNAADDYIASSLLGLGVAKRLWRTAKIFLERK